MTPPAAAAAPARTRTKRATPPPRRVSGPARGASGARPRAAAAAAPPLALRLGGAVHGIAEHRLLERIIRGRAWIAILGIGLIGIVFMQVSMLRLNAGIGRAVERTSLLERQNATTRAAISELSSGERIAAEAARLGLVVPPATPRFLDAAGADAARAVRSMTPPGEGILASPTGAAPETALTGAPVLGQAGVAATPPPATALSDTGEPTTATPSPAAPAATTAAPAATTPAPAPASPEPAHTDPPATAAPAHSDAPAAAAATGGADASGQVG